MRPGGTCVCSIRSCLLSVGLGCCRGPSLLYCSGVPLVVCHVNSSQRGEPSPLFFSETLSLSPPTRVPNLSPPRFSTSNAPRGSSRAAAYCGSTVPAGKSGSYSFVSPTHPSQWLCTTVGRSPLPLISLPKLGRVNIYQPPQEWPVGRRKGLTGEDARLL